MESLFNKLEDKPPEKRRVDLIRRNLLPEVQRGLAALRLDTVDELLHYGRTVEESYSRAHQYCPPTPATKGLLERLLEPNLAYQWRNKSGNSACAVELSRSEQQTTSAQSSLNKAIRCWHCGRTGHIQSRCPQRFKPSCFRCGRRGFTIKTCPQCSGNPSGSHEPANQ